MLRFFGLMDFLSGVCLILLYFGFFKSIGVLFGVYLLVKGILFIKNFVSWIDIASGIFILLSVSGYWYFVDWVIVIWLMQKGVLSFL